VRRLLRVATRQQSWKAGSNERKSLICPLRGRRAICARRLLGNCQMRILLSLSEIRSDRRGGPFRCCTCAFAQIHLSHRVGQSWSNPVAQSPTRAKVQIILFSALLWWGHSHAVRTALIYFRSTLDRRHLARARRIAANIDKLPEPLTQRRDKSPAIRSGALTVAPSGGWGLWG
jgi:hypothetical protein